MKYWRDCRRFLSESRAGFFANSATGVSLETRDSEAAINRSTISAGRVRTMDTLVETLKVKLQEWKPETAAQVRECIAEIIALADQQALDLLRSRAAEQQVLDMLDEPAAR